MSKVLNDNNADKIAQENKKAMEAAVIANEAKKAAEAAVQAEAAVSEDKAPAAKKELVKDDRFQLLEATKVYDSQDGKEHGFGSKSELMRWLFDQGMSVAQISHFTGNHYSFVHGVISSSREIVHEHTESRSDKIRELFDQGRKVGEIAKLLNANYSFVFGVIKKYKAVKEVG